MVAHSSTGVLQYHTINTTVSFMRGGGGGLNINVTVFAQTLKYL